MFNPFADFEKTNTMMTTEQRKKWKTKIASDTADYLSNGGTIQTIEPFTCAGGTPDWVINYPSVETLETVKQETGL